MGRRKKRIGGGDEGAPEWLTTYSDMVTLLLTFSFFFFDGDN